MKIFNRPAVIPADARPAAATVHGVAAEHHPQRAPITFVAPGAGKPVTFKIDAAVRVGDSLIVAGWHSEPVDFGLAVDAQPRAIQLFHTVREDVARHLGVRHADTLGFALVVDLGGGRDAVLRLPGDEGAAYALEVADVAATEVRSLLTPALVQLAGRLAPFGDAWCELVATIPVATGADQRTAGYVESALACEAVRQCIVSGWVAVPHLQPTWIEDERGAMTPLDGAWRSFRQDVYDAVASNLAATTDDNGFLVRVEGQRPGMKLTLRTLGERGVRVLAEATCAPLSADPVAAARLLFGIGTPLGRFTERLERVDAPLLQALNEARRAGWDSLPVQRRTLGKPPAAPRVSIIVPLYGRSDFVEHQLIEFVRDEWLKANAEVIYVIDDLRLAEPFAGEAEMLHRLYPMPFSWVWGGANRGFSGANNLGAQAARGEYLLFLNSDAFPRGPGWLPALLDVLQSRPDVGAVGPRLLFADGSIQHCGMEFRRREELGVWVNHHPRMGLDPALDPNTAPTEMAAVTGACLLMRRTDFDRVGGWDTGYLIGDFEDSDLCLKLQDAGMKVVYHPGVELTHLERQSFKTLGTGDFRTKVVLFNALRHQQRWGRLIEASAAAGHEENR